MFFQSKFVSSLEKVFCRQNLTCKEIYTVSGARGEKIAFQLVCQASEITHIQIDYELPWADQDIFAIREVGLVPSFNPAVADDPYIISSEPGLYPDPLLKMQDNRTRISAKNWHSFWCSVDIPQNMRPGKYEIKFHIFTPQDLKIWLPPEMHHYTSIIIEVLPFELPEQQLICTNWFHYDCLAIKYNVDIWSEEYWKLLEVYFQNMVAHGINMIMTPLWTAPLDTAINEERPTAQLLQISYFNNEYQFDFSRLERYLQLAKKCGFKYFEMPHAFTQWGAKACPKIVAETASGNNEKIFGWHTAANSAEYRNFLQSLMPQLLQVFKKYDLNKENTFFHISDEPTDKMLQEYSYASNLLRQLIENYPLIDALSHVELYRQGVIEIPIPTVEVIDDFTDENLPQRWLYYCGCNYKNGVPNCAFGMPSIRNRIIGILMYVYQIEGFLHWSYNFWFSQNSLNYDLDPYKDPEAGKGFTGGDVCRVYPGDNGPVDSLHYEIFAEALQDLRALQLLEKKIGREKVVELLHCGISPLKCSNYPKDNDWLLKVRSRINQAIMEN